MFDDEVFVRLLKDKGAAILITSDFDDSNKEKWRVHKRLVALGERERYCVAICGEGLLGWSVERIRNKGKWGREQAKRLAKEEKAVVYSEAEVKLASSEEVRRKDLEEVLEAEGLNREFTEEEKEDLEKLGVPEWTPERMEQAKRLSKEGKNEEEVDLIIFGRKVR
jgi:hypothetical protein